MTPMLALSLSVQMLLMACVYSDRVSPHVLPFTLRRCDWDGACGLDRL